MAQPSKTRFRSPPINEVVFQVVFPTNKASMSPHFGVFWSSIRDEFPTIQSAPRLGSINLPQVQNTFPENRFWLVHKSNQTVIQLQDDRFLFNWRLRAPEHAYPGYENLYPEFDRYLRQFCNFADSENFPIESFTGFELHYVNHIYLGKSVQNWEDAGNVLTPFNQPGVDRKMFPLTSVNFSTISQISESGDNLVVAIDSRTHNISKKELLNFEIRVSGSRESMGLQSMGDEFSTAHDQILDAFLKLSNRKIQREWEPV